MSGTYLLQQLINGVSLGSIYALVAIGYTMVYGILRLINFAHGDILMVGAYAALGLAMSLHLPFWAMLAGSMLIAALTGVLVERAAFRPVRGASEEVTMITSLAVSIFLENLGTMVLSPQPRKFSVPDYLLVIHNWGGLTFNNMTILIVVLAVGLMLALTLFVTRTNLGIAMRASSENLQAAQLMGININRIVAAAFIIGSGLAAVAGVMLGGQYGRIDPLMGFVPGLKAFVAAVIGGIGNIAGAAVGGYVLGLAEVLLVGLLPPSLSGFRDAFVFIFLILMLLIRPVGILGSVERGRA